MDNSDKNNDKKTVFRRIRGRIVPVSIGVGLIYSGRNDRSMKVGNSVVRSSQVGPIRVYTGSVKSKFKSFSVITDSSNKASRIQYIQTLEEKKGYGKELFKGMASNEKRLGKSFFRGQLATADTLKFSKRESTRFIKKFYSSAKSKIVDVKSAASLIKKHVNSSNYSVYSTTKIPKIRKIASKINLLSPALLIGAGILTYGLLKKDKK